MPRRSSPHPVDRLLVVAPNWLGDVVMTTPLLDWLQQARLGEGGPRFRLILAIRSAWAPLFAGDPRVDELVVTERPGQHAGIAGLVRLAARWREAKCDAALLAPPSLRVALVARLAGIPVRVGHRSDGRSLLLTRAVARPSRGTRHYSMELLELGRELATAAGWDALALPAVDMIGPASLAGAVTGSVPSHAAGGRPLWALGPGTTYGPAKTWTTRRIADFAAAAVAEDGVRLLLLGDSGAAPLVAALRAATPGLRWAAGEDAVDAEPLADVIDLTGATDLPAAVGWLRRCSAYIGNDSGLMHVAAALGTPTVGLFGSSNPDWTRPSGARVAVVTADGFACRPCYRRTCNQAVFCLDTVDGSRVLGAVRGLLRAGGDVRTGGAAS
ncbi:MAG: lipopolysaccharide heptosyltransferase II [bacterium]|nr:lipopolysaccharide heptosyltransferase II [bacterium]